MVHEPTQMERSIIQVRYALAGLNQGEIDGLVDFIESLCDEIKKDPLKENQKEVQGVGHQEKK